MIRDEEDDYRHVSVGSDSERGRTANALGEPVLDPTWCGRSLWVPRPRTRGECPTTRICPYVGCRHHLATDEVTIDQEKGPRARLASGFILLERNCALNFVDTHPGGATLEEVGEELLLTRERVRQIEVAALRKLEDTELYDELVGTGDL